MTKTKWEEILEQWNEEHPHEPNPMTDDDLIGELTADELDPGNPDEWRQ